MHCHRQLKKDGIALANAPRERVKRQDCCDELGDEACIRQFTNAKFSEEKSWIDAEAAC